MNSLSHRCNNVLRHGTLPEQSAAASARTVDEARLPRHRRQRLRWRNRPKPRAIDDKHRFQGHDPAHQGWLEARRLCQLATPLQRAVLAVVAVHGRRDPGCRVRNAAVLQGWLPRLELRRIDADHAWNARRPGFAHCARPRPDCALRQCRAPAALSRRTSGT